MYTADDFSKALDDYMQFNRDLMADIGPMNGILGVLGFGKKPGHDPGHEEFFREMNAAIDQVCKAQPDRETADGIADVIFQARTKYAEEKLSPFIFSAIEGMTKDLIPFLSDEKARQIHEALKKTPMKDRTPIRKQLLSELSKRNI